MQGNKAHLEMQPLNIASLILKYYKNCKNIQTD